METDDVRRLKELEAENAALKRIGVNVAVSLVTMSYNKENWVVLHQQFGSFATYTYSADNLKRTELVDGALTTLVWDGSDYLQGRS